VLFADSSRIRLEDLAEDLRSATLEAPAGLSAHLPSSTSAEDDDVSADGDGLKEQVKAAMSRLERELIIRALKQTQNNVTHAARLLKISRKGLQLKMKELNLRERDPE
jgi:two-component system response regulator AtoC